MRALVLVLAVILWAATGCDGVFGLTGGDRGGDDHPADAGSGSGSDAARDACVGSAFTSTQHLELGTGLSDPTLTNDQLEVFVAMNGLILTATRPSPTAAFGALSKVDLGFALMTNASDPALTLDGLDLVFAMTAPDPGIYEITRNAGSPEWSKPTRIVDSFPDGGLDVSPDGLHLYVQMGSNALFDYTRVTRTAAFGPPAALGIPASFPSVTENGLRVYYTDSNVIMTSTRPASGALFGPGTPFVVDGAAVTGNDADASATGETVIRIGVEDAVDILTRGCP